MKVSPLAPKETPDLPVVQGVTLATIASEVRYTGRDDLLLVAFEEGTTTAGVLTQSTSASAPVRWCKQQLIHRNARALVVNAGNANTFTGQIGVGHVELTAKAASTALGCDQNEIYIASTGVIGEFLPIEKITDNLQPLKENLSTENWEEASEAILTTDTFAKRATRITKIDDTTITINGIAKGSGMIEPNMATMLTFFFTDANIDGSILQQLLEESNHDSFNAITVDSDTSTSDTCLLFATNQAKNVAPNSAEDHLLSSFKAALQDIMRDLAIQVVKDGEGASKLIEIDVSGAESDEAARKVAKSIANSPLVKTAIAGQDANWGRVVMAVGKSGQQAPQDKLQISFGGIAITENGQPKKDYQESVLTEHLKGNHIQIDVGLGVGQGVSKVWTCDLTHTYIDINADYRS